MSDFKVELEILSSNWVELTKNILLAIGPILGFITQQYVMDKRKEKENRADKIRLELQNFYYPIIELIRKNKILYDIFSNSDNSRTLMQLLKEKKFSNNEKALLKKIIEIDNEINLLILKYQCIIKNDKNLSDMMNKASIHFILIDMAFNGDIIGEVDKFSQYIYPRDLEKNISDRIELLNDELIKLGVRDKR